MKSILIVEDEPIISESLSKLLIQQGYTTYSADCVANALTIYDNKTIDLVITDIRLPDQEGTELIHLCQPTPVLVMTSFASVRSAVAAMKLGAVNYIAKPFSHEEMLLNIKKIFKETSLQRQNEVLKNQLSKQYPVQGIVGKSDAMQKVFSLIDKVAPTDSTVLILGESGTGKELVARALHEKSQRKDSPIITVNCAAIPEGLIETELFGHEKGAFTGAVSTHKGLIEAADGGTLFLDEIGELPLDAQARLLRVLQEKETRKVGSTQLRKIDIRLIAATHRDLKQLIHEQKFREDLFFRLNVVTISLPPLRARSQDLTILAETLLSRACEKLNRPMQVLTQKSLELIHDYHWPGNVRELENAIERAVILSDGTEIQPEHLGLDLFSLPNEPNTAHSPDGEAAGQQSMEAYFKQFVLKHQASLTETELAKRLGISRKSLWEKRQKLGIPKAKKEEHMS